MEYLAEFFVWVFHDTLYLWLGRRLFGESFTEEPRKVPAAKRAILYVLTFTAVIAALYFVALFYFRFKG